MSSPSKITNGHRERLALVYIRQSSLAQVRENTESTARQYALADEAARLGWQASQIVTLDADLGVSARHGSMRAGFKELVSRVCLGEVGAVFGLEVSRLARSSADLQRLLEFCSLTDTLIIDADGIYDLKLFNDRLLVGLKGTMSEAELHILAGRLQESKRAAALRGELRFPLPVGYVYDDEGETILDPDEEIRTTLAEVFLAFEATGSAYGVVGRFRERRFPRRAYGGAWAGTIHWGFLTHSRVLSILSNPAYAGTYVFGRFHSRRIVDGDGTIRTKTMELAREKWPVVIQGHHPAYITWDTFLANERRLAANHTRNGERPPREGAALLQGMVICGGCGRPMSIIYSSNRPSYDCTHSRSNHTKTPACRSVTAALVDGIVGERMLAAVTPKQIAMALSVAEEVTDRRARSTRALDLQLERARYEAARAERAFHLCDPENRLVARSLEQRWEEKLSFQAEAEAALAAAQAATVPLPLRPELEALASDLPFLWKAPTTSPRDRKRLLRTLVADVTLMSEAGPKVRVGIHWRTGAMEESMVFRSMPRQTPGAVIEEVRRLRDCSNKEIVAALAEGGLRTGTGRTFDEAAVRWIRFAYAIPDPVRALLLRPGELTVMQVAERLGISKYCVYDWIGRGRLNARRESDGRLCVSFPTEVEKVCRERIVHCTRIKSRTQTRVEGGVV